MQGTPIADHQPKQIGNWCVRLREEDGALSAVDGVDEARTEAAENAEFQRDLYVVAGPPGAAAARGGLSCD